MTEEEPFIDEETLHKMIVEEGKSFKQIEKELGISDSTVRSWANVHGIKKPLNDKELLAEKLEEGWGIQDMMVQWNVPHHKVYVALNRHGLLDNGED